MNREHAQKIEDGLFLEILTPALPYLGAGLTLFYFICVEDRQRWTPLFFLVVVSLFIIGIFTRRKVPEFKTPVDGLINMLFTIFAFTSLLAYDLTGGWYGFLFLMLGLNAVYLAIDFLKDEERLRWSMRGLAIFNIFTVIIGIRQFLNWGLEVSSIFPCPNHFAMYLLLTAPPLFILADKERLSSLKALLYIATVLSLTGIFLSYTRAAMVGLICECAVLFIYRYRVRMMALVFGLSLLLALPFCGKFVPDLLKPSAMKHPSDYFRLYSWDAALNMIEDSPIWGFGFFSYENTYPAYQLIETTWRDQEPHNV